MNRQKECLSQYWSSLGVRCQQKGGVNFWTSQFSCQQLRKRLRSFQLNDWKFIIFRTHNYVLNLVWAIKGKWRETCRWWIYHDGLLNNCWQSPWLLIFNYYITYTQIINFIAISPKQFRTSGRTSLWIHSRTIHHFLWPLALLFTICCNPAGSCSWWSPSLGKCMDCRSVWNPPSLFPFYPSFSLLTFSVSLRIRWWHENFP